VVKPTVGVDELGGEQVVTRQAVAAHQPAQPTAEGEPGDAGVGDDAAGGGQPVGLGARVELSPQCTRLGLGGGAGGVDPDGRHGGQVEHQAVVATGGARDAVPATADRDGQALLEACPQGGGDVGGVRAARDECRVPVDRAVPQGPGGVVAGVHRGGQPSPEPVAQRRHHANSWA
jgi:hypothetical protein